MPVQKMPDTVGSDSAMRFSSFAVMGRNIHYSSTYCTSDSTAVPGICPFLALSPALFLGWGMVCFVRTQDLSFSMRVG